MPLINAYTANDISDGDEALFIIKAMVFFRGGEKFYRFYRCLHHLTPGTSFGNIGVFEIPQGDRIHSSEEEIETIARLLFPILVRCGAKPDFT